MTLFLTFEAQRVSFVVPSVRIRGSTANWRSGRPQVKRRRGILMVYDALTSAAVVNILAAFALLLVVFGHLVWLAERKTNPEFPRKYWDGIDEGCWYAARRANPAACAYCTYIVHHRALLRCGSHAAGAGHLQCVCQKCVRA